MILLGHSFYIRKVVLIYIFILSQNLHCIVICERLDSLTLKILNWRSKNFIQYDGHLGVLLSNSPFYLPFILSYSTGGPRRTSISTFITHFIVDPGYLLFSFFFVGLRRITRYIYKKDQNKHQTEKAWTLEAINLIFFDEEFSEILGWSGLTQLRTHKFFKK